MRAWLCGPAVVLACAAAAAAAQEGLDGLNSRVLALYEQGRFAAAVPVAEQAVRLAERRNGATDEGGRVALNNLAVIYENVERLAEAEETYGRAIALAERSGGRGSVGVAQCLTNLALFHKRRGRYDRAEPLYREAIDIFERRLGRDHPDTARAANNLGELYRALGQAQPAKEYLVRGLEARIEAYGERHPEVAQSLNNLGLLAYDSGAPDVAGRLLAAALDIRIETLGADHPLTGQTLSNLTLVRIATRDLDEAERLVDRSLAVKERAFGRNHTETAIALFNKANVRKLQGRFRDAEPSMREAEAIVARAIGPDDPRTITMTDGLGSLLAGIDAWDEAAGTIDRARRATRRHVAHVLPALSDAEQNVFLRTQDNGGLHGALTLGLVRKSSPRIAALSAGWLANGKAVAQEAASQRIVLARQSADPATAAAVAALEKVRADLAKLSQVTPSPDEAAAHRKTIATRRAEEQRLVHEIGGQLAAVDRDEPWVEIDAVRQNIPAGSVLVDVARFSVFDFEAHGKESIWRPARYAAWIVPPAGAGDVTILDLGEAEGIDAAVGAYREAVQAGQQGFRRGQAAAEEELKVTAAPLSSRVLQPIVAAIGTATDIILSPDGALWLVPWQALSLADGSYCVETFSIRTVTSARDLVPVPVKARGAAGGPVVVADPAFDAMPSASGSRSGAGSRAASQPSSQELVRKFARLASTRSEALATKAAISRLTGSEPRMLLGPDATETNVRQAAVRPRTLVLATHGFFLKDQEVKRDDAVGLAGGGGSRGTTRAVSTAGESLEDPLLRCGLALAGANAVARDGGDDGILTGAEIVGLDLLGTDLVVLSACETGVGTVHNGEGVAGLRQAFQIAGAKSVVATLWQVPDAESAAIMAGFYANLARGRTASQALREAQLDFIKARREDRNYEAAHPYLWAAYGVTGR